MQRRAFVLGGVAGLVLARPALAARDFVAEILRELEAQGYGEIEVSRTLLGRTRITASGARGHREIIVNPVTGEILRDLRLGYAGEEILGGSEESSEGSGDDDGSGGDDDGGDDSSDGGDDDGGDDDGDDDGGDDGKDDTSGEGGGDDGGGDDGDDGGGDDGDNSGHD